MTVWDDHESCFVSPCIQSYYVTSHQPVVLSYYTCTLFLFSFQVNMFLGFVEHEVVHGSRGGNNVY
jgi:hypothetical protein